MEDRSNRGLVNPRIWHIVTALCIIGLTGVSVYRAATQAITHDEAVTWERYVSGPLYRLVSSTDANNHILHSLLCRFSVGVVGASELSLRLPSVVAGMLFLVLLARIGGRVWGSSPATPVAVLLLGLNPFVLDYLSAARGYSLALMFWVAALDRLLAAAQEPGRWAKGVEPDIQLRRASQYLALAVLANLTFAPAAVALVACWGLWAWGERRRQSGESPAETRAWFWQNLGRPGAIVFACLALPLVKLGPGSFYFGAPTASLSLRSLVHASFAHHPQTWPIDNTAGWYQALLDRLALTVIPALVLGLVALWVVTAAALWRGRTAERRPPEAGAMLFHLSAGTLGLTLVMLAVLHGIGMKLPLERTGLYLLPPLGLAFLSAGAGLASIRHWSLWAWLGTWLSRGALAACALLCLVWGAQIQTSHYRPWLYDSDSRAVFRTIASMRDPSSKRVIRVAATWMMAPSLNFYRNLFRADHVERIERSLDYPADPDLYVVATGAGGRLPPEPVDILYHNPVTGTILAVPARGRPTASGGK